jgi:NADH:ubiquinone oxidoreductase subunit 2 (subunit N)
MLFIYILIIINLLFILILIKNFYKKFFFFNIYDLKNFFFIDNKLLFLFNVNFFSVMGLPPFLSFFGKFDLLNNLIILEYYFFVFFIMLTSLFSCFYYLNLIQKGYIIKIDKYNKIDKNYNLEFKDLFLDKYLLLLIYFISIYIFYLQLNLSEIVIYLYIFK